MVAGPSAAGDRGASAAHVHRHHPRRRVSRPTRSGCSPSATRIRLGRGTRSARGGPTRTRGGRCPRRPRRRRMARRRSCEHRLAVLLNRDDLSDRSEDELVSRGSIVLASVAGSSPGDAPRTHGFNLVEVVPGAARVTMWDGIRARVETLAPGTHMIAHDDVDDPATPRIAHWLDEFRRTPLGARTRMVVGAVDVDPRSQRRAGADRRPRDRPRQPPARLSHAVDAHLHRLAVRDHGSTCTTASSSTRGSGTPLSLT